MELKKLMAQEDVSWNEGHYCYDSPLSIKNWKPKRHHMQILLKRGDGSQIFNSSLFFNFPHDASFNIH